jgi:sulfonate dioxygenase
MMASLESRENISPDSGFPITLHPHFHPKIKDHIPSEPSREEIDPGKDRALALLADPGKKTLLVFAKRKDLTKSIPIVLEGI